MGTVAAARGVTISTESAGVVRAIRFESGAKVRTGQLLVELDAGVERAQLASLKARLDLAASNATRTRNLVESGAYTKVQLETDEAQLKTVSADVEALKAQIDRKVVRAPFAGKLGIRAVNLGQYVNPGTPITVLESTESVFVDFTIPQQELARVPVGSPVRIVLPGAKPPRTLPGKIAALDPSVDAVTRSVKLRASVEEDKDELRPGMFVNVSVQLPERVKVISVPATAILRAPYGDSVFRGRGPQGRQGRHRQGPGRQAGQGGPPAVRAASGSRGATSWRSTEGIKAGQEVVEPGGVQAAQRRPDHGEQPAQADTLADPAAGEPLTCASPTSSSAGRCWPSWST